MITGEKKKNRKMKKGQNIGVYIANERNTSQTCVLCSKKLAGLLRVLSDENGCRKAKFANMGLYFAAINHVPQYVVLNQHIRKT